MKLSSILFNILLRIIYLTPLGPMITVFYLTANKKFPGMLVSHNRIYIVEKPTLKDRLDWIINGIFILAEAYFIFLKFLKLEGEDWIIFNLMVLPFIFAFGITAIIYGIFPRFPGNKISTILGIIIFIAAIFLAFLLM